MSRRSRRKAFTLVEILVAVTIAAVLIAAVLALLTDVGRDHKRLAADLATFRPDAVVELLRWDLTNADSITPTRDGIALRGHGGIDAATLRPNNRLVLVSYVVRREGRASYLVRDQRYLDDPVRPQPWSDVVTAGVAAVTVTPVGSVKPERVTVRLAFSGSRGVTEQLWVR